MKNLLNYTSLSVFILLAIATGCQKCDSGKPYNPLNGRTTAIFNPDKTYGTVYDIDGNEYKTIVIGTQTWMAENLRTTRYRNGDAIPHVTVNADWAALESGAYCFYRNTTNLDTIATKGGLYNWFAAVDPRNITPKGWHVPTDAEWATLITYLGVDSVASTKLKEAGNKHWLLPAYGQKSTNESGFTALPGGCREDYDGSFFNFFGGGYGYFWSSSVDDFEYVYYIVITYFNTNNLIHTNSSLTKKAGFSIRCIKDN